MEKLTQIEQLAAIEAGHVALHALQAILPNNSKGWEMAMFAVETLYASTAAWPHNKHLSAQDASDFVEEVGAAIREAADKVYRSHYPENN